MSNKYTLVSVLFLFLVQTIMAQHKISGNIKDQKTNQNIKGALVYLNELKTSVITDENGNYEIKNIKTGNYLIEISLQGYTPIANHYKIEKDTTIDFLLSSNTLIELSEVVVTGINQATQIKQNAYATT